MKQNFKKGRPLIQYNVLAIYTKQKIFLKMTKSFIVWPRAVKNAFLTVIQRVKMTKTWKNHF